jgi:hypothetical protein
MPFHNINNKLQLHINTYASRLRPQSISYYKYPGENLCYGITNGLRNNHTVE